MIETYSPLYLVYLASAFVVTMLCLEQYARRNEMLAKSPQELCALAILTFCPVINTIAALIIIFEGDEHE